VSWRKWYAESWSDHYAHSGWSSLCDDEVLDEAPIHPHHPVWEPYFEEWEEALDQWRRRLLRERDGAGGPRPLRRGGGEDLGEEEEEEALDRIGSDLA